MMGFAILHCENGSVNEGLGYLVTQLNTGDTRYLMGAGEEAVFLIADISNVIPHTDVRIVPTTFEGAIQSIVVDTRGVSETEVKRRLNSCGYKGLSLVARKGDISIFNATRLGFPITFGVNVASVMS